MYTNLQQFEEEKVKEYLALPLGTREGHVDFLRTAIRQAGELTVENVYGLGNTIATTVDTLKETDGSITDTIRANAKSWISNEQPQ